MRWEGVSVVSFEFFATKCGAKYGVLLKIGTIITALEVDTGSPVTIISYQSLLKTLSSQDITSIFDKLNMDDYTKECAIKSATGNGIFFKPAVLHDIQLGGCTISKMGIFVSNIARPLTLLGTDFLDACSINKECGGSMLFRTVNENLAFENFESRIKEFEVPSTGIPDIMSYVQSLNVDTVGSIDVSVANPVNAFK